MPVILLCALIPTGIALLLALRSSGWKKWLAWGGFALLALPLIIAGVGGMLLSANGLAWRSCVKLPCGLAFVAGVLLLLVRAGIFLWIRAADRGPVTEMLQRSLFTLAISFLCLVIGLYGIFFSAVWAGADRVVERNGRMYVEEQVLLDSDLYSYSAYCGHLVRGSRRLLVE